MTEITEEMIAAGQEVFRLYADDPFDQHVVRRIYEAVHAVRPSEWRPISEAPMDGTDVLLATENGLVCIGRFEVEHNDSPEGHRPFGGWLSDCGNIQPPLPAWRDLEAADAINEPTHFMPLPPPPTTESETASAGEAPDDSAA